MQDQTGMLPKPVRSFNSPGFTIFNPVTDFDIKCWIRTGLAGLARPLTLKSTMNFVDVKGAVAEILGIRETSVELAYAFSFTRVAGDTRYLTTEDEWKGLVNDATIHRNKPQVKAAGTQSSWSVQLRELRELIESKESGKVCCRLILFFLAHLMLWTEKEEDVTTSNCWR